MAKFTIAVVVLATTIAWSQDKTGNATASANCSVAVTGTGNQIKIECPASTSKAEIEQMQNLWKGIVSVMQIQESQAKTNELHAESYAKQTEDNRASALDSGKIIAMQLWKIGPRYRRNLEEVTPKMAIDSTNPAAEAENERIKKEERIRLTSVYHYDLQQLIILAIPLQQQILEGHKWTTNDYVIAGMMHQARDGNLIDLREDQVADYFDRLIAAISENRQQD